MRWRLLASKPQRHGRKRLPATYMAKRGPKPKEKEPEKRVRIYGKCKHCGSKGDVNLGLVCDQCRNQEDDWIKETVRRWKDGK